MARTSSLRRKRRSQAEITRLILDAAAAEFERSGYSGATTGRIARAADVTEAQLFRYFPSKAELFRAAVFVPLNRHFCEFQSRRLADGSRSHEQQVRQYIAELQDFMASHGRTLMSLLVSQLYPSEPGNGETRMAGLDEYFARGAALMEARLAGNARVDPKVMVRISFVAVLANAVLKDWIFPDGLASDAAIRDAVMEFMVHGLSANRG